MSTLTVTTGHTLALRLYDVAYSIDLAAAERLWATQTNAAVGRARLSATAPKAVRFGVAPLSLDLGEVELKLADEVARAAATARVYDFGVVSLALKVAADGREVTAFARLMNDVEDAVGPGTATPVWSELLARVRGVIGAAWEKPNPASVEEDYLLGVVHAFDGKPSARELLQRVDFVPMLAGEYRPLSEAAKNELTRQRFSYYEDDLVILTWDRAFIYEPRGDSDVDDVLEVANAQLLEMRYYDDVLDAELPRMYDAVESTRRIFNAFAARRYARLARDLNALVAEVTELTEKVDNALQVTEDVYLARVYAAALDSFRVRSVHAAVERKLAIIRDTYRALYEEASSSRAELMEITVIVLIAVEILLAVLRH
ncbi:MAG TPA: hypothetical protein VGN52_16885 [Burkholderiales bacterium]